MNIKQEMEKSENQRFCPACNRPLVRRDGEEMAAWKRRICCNRGCSTVNRKLNFAGKPGSNLATQREGAGTSGVYRYVPGSKEFNEIAQQYLNRKSN